MFVHHGTFIIAFSLAKNHISVAPEKAVLKQSNDEITEAGYTDTREIFRIE